MNFKLISDSASNLFDLPGSCYAFVPLTIHCDNREFPDIPQLDLEEMLHFLQNTDQRSSTSCPNVQDWLDAFEGADRVLAITITGALSGSFSAAMQAREIYLQEHPDARVEVLDSLSAGPEMELLLEKAAQLHQKGYSLEEIAESVKQYAQTTHLLFCLKSLTNLARNGRINSAKAKLAGILGIRVVGKASAEGTLQPLHNCRGAVKSQAAILAEMKQNGFVGGKVRIAHCRNAAATEALRESLLEYAPSTDITIRDCTALCSFYAEEGGLMIGFEG